MLIRVAVVDTVGGGLGGGAATVAQLNDDTFFDFAATLADPSGVDTAAELENYDAVVLGGSGAVGGDPVWTVAMADAVRVFVEAGGGVVMTGWGHQNAFSGGGATNAAAAATLDSVVPGDLDAVYSFTVPDTSINLTDLSHPITQGLPASFAHGSGYCLEYNRHPLQPGDIAIGVPAVTFPLFVPGNALIYREGIGPGGGRSVYLGAIHMANPFVFSSVQGGLRSGPGDQLLEQALAWVAPTKITITPRELKEQAVEDLAALLVSVVGKVAEEIEEALEELRESLEDDLWADNSHLVPDDGEDVFDEEKDAVKSLMKALEAALKDGDTGTADELQRIINSVLFADETLAQTAIVEATDPKAIARAEDLLAEGQAARDAGDFDKAVKRFGQAWEKVTEDIEEEEEEDGDGD